MSSSFQVIYFTSTKSSRPTSMSILFIRCVQRLPARTGMSRFVGSISMQPDRNYHVDNCRLLRESTKQSWAAVNYSSIRTLSTPPPTEPGTIPEFEELRSRVSSLIADYASSDVVLAATEKMVQFHDYVGLPWWSVIVISTLALRTLVTLPFAIHQQYVMAKYEHVMEEVNTTIDREVTQKMKKLAEEKKWSQKQLTSEYFRAKEEKKKELIRKYNCHPLKLTVLLLVQTPLWITLSCVIRNLTYMLPTPDVTAQIVHAEMKLNSFLWMSDLTAPEPSLGFAFVIINWLTVSVSVLGRKGKKNYIEKILVLFHSVFCILLGTLALELPLSIVLYWTTSSFFSVIQNIIFLSPKIRKRLHIPLDKHTRPNPYRTFVNKCKSFYKFFRY